MDAIDVETFNPPDCYWNPRFFKCPVFMQVYKNLEEFTGRTIGEKKVCQTYMGELQGFVNRFACIANLKNGMAKKWWCLSLV